MLASLKQSAVGAAIIKAFESCLAPVKGRPGLFTTYLCPAGVLTIGWGHTNHHGRSFKSGEVWTQTECDAEFASDMALFEKSVKQTLADVELNQHEFDSLLSLSYNIGPLTRSSIPDKLRSGRRAEVPAVMARWNKAGGKVLAGLTRRRKAEAQLFVGDVDAALETAQVLWPTPMPQAVDTPKPPVSVVAKETKRETAALAAGGTVAAGSGSQADAAHPFDSALTVAGVALGIAVVAAAVWLMIRKYNAVAKDWR